MATTEFSKEAQEYFESLTAITPPSRLVETLPKGSGIVGGNLGDEYQDRVQAAQFQHNRDGFRSKEEYRSRLRSEFGPQEFLPLWLRSESLLQMLRTDGLGPQITDEKLNDAWKRFYHRVHPADFPECDTYKVNDDWYTKANNTLESFPGPEKPSANGYFDVRFPKLTEAYGRAFYSLVLERPTDPFYHSQACHDKEFIGMNDAFFGALLGGDKRFGHDVRYILPEARFYFLDSVDDIYVPTYEAKLRMLLNRLLRECASGMKPEQATMLLGTYQSDRMWDAILYCAKATLATNEKFFETEGGPRRWLASDKLAKDQRASVEAFVREEIEAADGILTYGEVLKRIQARIGPTLPKNVRELLYECIKSVHGKKLRNDLRDKEGSCVRAWAGLGMKPDGLMLVN